MFDLHKGVKISASHCWFQAVGGGNGPGQTVALSICDLSPHSLRSGQTIPVAELQFESMPQEETTELSATRGKGQRHIKSCMFHCNS